MILRNIIPLRAPGLVLLLTLLFVRVAPAAQPTPPATNAVAAAESTEPEVYTVAAPPRNQEKLTFGLNKVAALQAPLFGIPAWQYLASAIYIFIALMVSRVLDFLVCLRLKKGAPAGSFLTDSFLDLARGPAKLIAFVVFLHMGLQVFAWPFWLEVWLKRVLHLLVAVSLTYMLLKVIDTFVARYRQRLAAREDKTFNDQLFPIITKSLKAFVLVVSVLATSQNLGLDITSVLASLSIGGLALGLAAQDTVANLFGAVAVFVDKPFKIGDSIKLDNVEGSVESIGLRSTRVRNLEGSIITVPNKTMGNATITNITRRPAIKTEMNLGLVYDTPAEKVREAVSILEEVYRGHPKTSDLSISFNKFTSTALNIQIVHWWGGLDNKAYLAGMQDLNLAVKDRFDKAGIRFAFPSQTVYLRQEPERTAGKVA